MERIPSAFLNNAASIIAETAKGLSGPKIVEVCNYWAADANVNTPHSSYPFRTSVPNKRTALYENLGAFPPSVQYDLLLDLCDRVGDQTPGVTKLREQIKTRFAHLSLTPGAIPATPMKNNAANANLPRLKVFLCHATEDKPKAEALYHRLQADGFQPWLDKFNLIPGQNWKLEIDRAVRDSHVVVVCLSTKSISKEGFAQAEIRRALDVANEKPEGTIFIVPLRLELCRVPDRLIHLHYVDLYESGGYTRLADALNERGKSI